MTARMSVAVVIPRLLATVLSFFIMPSSSDNISLFGMVGFRLRMVFNTTLLKGRERQKKVNYSTKQIRIDN